MEFEAQQQINQQISSSERVLWADRPKRGSVVQWSDVRLSIFGVIWLGMLIPHILLIFKDGGGPFFPKLFMVPFLLVGLYYLFGRYIHDAWLRSRTFYGLTDQRVIIISGLFGTSVRSLPMKSLPELNLKEKSNGSGSIVFGGSSYWWFASMAWPGSRRNGPPVIELVDDVRGVYNQILAAQQDT